MNCKITSLDALEILDSRGNPTVRAFVTLGNGITAAASVPSGASTGEGEAHELRDGDGKRYGGRGVLRAVQNVRDIIGPEINGLEANRQGTLDKLMLELDGTPNKHHLGANAILAVSMAVARAAALASGLPLYTYLGSLLDDGPPATHLPMPMMNILNGGKHADNSIDFQEFMIVPVGAPCFAEALRYGVETFQALRVILKTHGYGTGVGDEGGFAPNLGSDEEACELILRAIRGAGYEPGRDLALAIDPAASSFWTDSGYTLASYGLSNPRTSIQLSALYAEWIHKYHIVSIEDGLAEHDWQGFAAQTAVLGDRVQIVGDDIYCTNVALIERGIRENTTNAVLIKLNQIGTITETVNAINLCRNAGWNYVISHRSGETEDTFLADFAVAMGGGQIKTGSACRGERIAKYNRLLEIEAQLGTFASFTHPFQHRK